MISKLLYKNRRVSFGRETTNLGKFLLNTEEDLYTFGDKTLYVHGSVIVAILNNHEVTLTRKISLLEEVADEKDEWKYDALVS